jgi:parallel beta-helix repeat protein
VYHSAVGVLSMNSFENTISHNHIHHLYYTGISAGWVWGYSPSVSKGNAIEHNYIHHIGQKMLSDMGAIYTLGAQPGGVIRGNHIHDVDSWSYGGWGIYTDEGSSNILIENNLVYRTKTGGFHQHYGKENTVRNNIFALMTQDMLQNSRAEPHLGFTFEKNIVYSAGAKMLGNNWTGTNFKLANNLYFDTTTPAPKFAGVSFEDWKKKGHDEGSQLADPLFENPAKDDFRLKPDSPALKLGFQPFDATKAGPRK